MPLIVRYKNAIITIKTVQNEKKTFKSYEIYQVIVYSQSIHDSFGKKNSKKLKETRTS